MPYRVCIPRLSLSLPSQQPRCVLKRVTLTFNYEMACAEICGRGHFSMRFPVFVHDSVEDYENWLKSQDAWLKQNPDYLKQDAS
jgi:heme/copper-type cytochrome/quinol oxidase subunit 2